jgi:hypothetical protein
MLRKCHLVNIKSETVTLIFLGKLSKAQIKGGYQCLSDIQVLIDEDGGAKKHSKQILYLTNR